MRTGLTHEAKHTHTHMHDLLRKAFLTPEAKACCRARLLRICACAFWFTFGSSDFDCCLIRRSAGTILTVIVCTRVHSNMHAHTLRGQHRRLGILHAIRAYRYVYSAGSTRPRCTYMRAYRHGHESCAYKHGHESRAYKHGHEPSTCSMLVAHTIAHTLEIE